MSKVSTYVRAVVYVCINLYLYVYVRVGGCVRTHMYTYACVYARACVRMCGLVGSRVYVRKECSFICFFSHTL